MSGKFLVLSFESRVPTSELGADDARIRTRHPQLATRHSPLGMTLIELLVAIVILVTVLGAVIPVISPNNDARRIRSGARQLQSMLAQAQALAAREGRPYGVAFKEIGLDTDGNPSNGFETGDSTALEVYFISEPKPYAGFSEFSRVRLSPEGGNGPGHPVRMQFVLAGQPQAQPYPLDLPADPFPPNLIRRGDRIEVNGVVYRMIDLDRDGTGNDLDEAVFPEGSYYTPTNPQPEKTWLCQPEQPRPPLPLHQPPGGPQATNPLPYRFLRQSANPATRPGNTSAPPLVMPRGVAIDMIASGTDVIFPDPTLALSPQCGFTTKQSDRQTALMNDGNFYPFRRPLTVGVLFAPSGRLETVWINGEKLNGTPDHVYLLVGRAENSLRTGAEKLADTDFNGVPGGPNQSPDPGGDAELLERRQRLNWLNGDSMWVTIGGHTGRIVASDNDISTDPRLYASVQVLVQLANQIRDARELAQEMSSSARQ